MGSRSDLIYNVQIANKFARITKQKLTAWLQVGEAFWQVPGSCPVPVGSRSDLIYNEQIANKFTRMTLSNLGLPDKSRYEGDMSIYYELKDICDSLDIKINEDKLNKFESYYELLNEWNSRFNLTAISDEREILYKHFIDSISILRFFDIKDRSKIIDVGTGAGFPGLPLKIMLPDISLTLIDSVKKKLTFVEEAVKVLSLKDVEILNTRAEIISRETDYRESFDYCVSRAVANLTALSEYCIPFVKLNGYFISYKGSNYEDEYKAAGKIIKELGGKSLDPVLFSLDDSGSDGRCFIIIEKIKHTPFIYPRENKIIKNNTAKYK